VPHVVLARRAQIQIAETLVYTRKRFGDHKYREYRELVDLALQALAERAEVGTRRLDLHPDAWTYHIARPGKNARHLFLYRIRTEVEIGRFLYDGMDLPSHWPKEWHAV
jgi:plasmid stabilization system protein ParE